MNFEILMLFAQGVVSQTPVLLACIAGGAIVISRWNQMPASRTWALLGFGTGAALCILSPLTTAIFQGMISGGTDVHTARGVLSSITLLWSLLRGASYGFLVAALACACTPPKPPPRE